MLYFDDNFASAIFYMADILWYTEQSVPFGTMPRENNAGRNI